MNENLKILFIRVGILCYSFLILIFLDVRAQGTWSKLDVPTDNFLRSVHFTDSLTGWAAGNGGVIIHTEDGGNSWTVQESNTDYDIADIEFLNRDYGWATAQNYMNSPFGTVLLKTSDGGQNWIPQSYPQNDIFINCILFRDSLDIWMGGSPHALVHSTDGGQSWQQAIIDTSILAFFPVLSIQFWDDQYGYACGGMFEIAGVIWRTNDGGQTWYAIDPEFAPADEVHELHLYDSLHVIGSGGDPDFGYGVAFIRTSDGGLTWEYEEIGLPGNSYDLDFVTDSEAWAPLGARHQLIYSTDAGDTWEAMETPEFMAIYDIMFPDFLHGWAVGDNGAVLKYKPPLGVSADPVEISETSFYLRNYPNPFKEKTTIQFQIPNPKSQIPNNNQIPNPKSQIPNNIQIPNPKSQNTQSPNQSYRVQLKVYNGLGLRVALLLDTPLPPSDYEVLFDANGLPPGIYYCRLLINGENGGTIKMIISNH